jgi:hypothetical protein
MNFQTKRVVRATLLGLSASILVAAVNIMAEDADALLKDFSGCYANSMADRMTNEEVKYRNEHGNWSPNSISKMSASFENCREASYRKLINEQPWLSAHAD